MATILTLAQYRMNNDHMDGWGWGMAILMVVALVAIVALVVWLVRSTGAPLGHAHHVAATASETPMQILDRRLAHGEITPEEHKERAAVLGKQ